jgi:hypothetical protein
MTTGGIISLLGITLILIYIISKIMDFNGVSSKEYGSYITFYMFLLLSFFILPNNYSSNITA